MSRLLIVIFFCCCGPLPAAAQTIKVNPIGVNVDSQGASTAFLTFGGLNNHAPAEGCWCGDLVPATPDLGFKCNPATLFGCLPGRFNLSTPSGNQGFTDIMSIPPSVARRAYQSAASGDESRFFYVRRFVSTVGGPDEYVAVTCRLTGGRARAPFALTDVKLSFDVDKPVLFVKQGEKLSAIKAEISYNGTGRLIGRWEVVMPGEELPTERDLLTEATLPVEERGQQKRYTQLSRFNIFLPPIGRYVLAGPDVSRVPNEVEGLYLVLLRIEATDDREGDSNLAAAGAGIGVVHSGGVAGFPMPPLRYFVGGGPSALLTSELALLWPVENGVHLRSKPLNFSWTEIEPATFYRLEVEDAQGRAILSALVPSGTWAYRAPPWLKDKAGDGILRWRVLALGQNGNSISETPWRSLRLTP